MSLLIKALQKAEQNKAGVAGGAPPPGGLQTPGKELSTHHTDHDLSAEAGFEPAPAAVSRPIPAVDPIPRPAVRTPQQAAAALFAAKQEETPDEGISRAVTMGLIGIAFLLLVGGGIYFYLDSFNQPELVAARPAPVAQQTVPSQAAPVAPAVQPAAEILPAPVAEAPALPAAEVQNAAEEKVAQPASLTAAATQKAVSAELEDVAVKVTRSRSAASMVNSRVMAGYQAYVAGDDAAAQRLYQQALQSDPRNIDALLGLAAIATRGDETEQAGGYFMQVLELEPANAAAQAGLIGLMGQSDPQAGESRLKSMLAQQPEAAFLHAALGNLYAGQNQWPSAQQAYFQAYRYDADNPEYAFNLAVSLDHMGKAALAARHYERALELLPEQGAAGLDRGEIQARIVRLRQTAPQ